MGITRHKINGSDALQNGSRKHGNCYGKENLSAPMKRVEVVSHSFYAWFSFVNVPPETWRHILQMKNCFKATFAAVAAATALASFAGTAHADLNAFGEVGLPQNPTAQIPEQGGARVQANYYELYDVNGGGLNANGKLYSIVGAFRAGDNIEVSGGIHRTTNDFSFLGVNNNSKDTGFSLGAKYLFTRESDPAKVRLAAGGNYTDFGLIKTQHIYGVASKSLTNPVDGKLPITGHLGVRYDRWDPDAGGTSDKFSAFVGAEVPLTATGQFQVVGEAGSKQIDGGKFPYSLALRYRPASQPFGISAGVARQGGFSNLGDNSSHLFVQVGYTFGK